MSPASLIRKNTNTLTIATLLLTLAGIFSIYFFFIKQSGEAEAWHETGWLYRQGVPITNTGAELTDYQVAVTVDTATLIGAGKMQSDCRDIRFAGKSGEELPYWIESGCNSASTKIWVKVDRVPANSSATFSTIYLYYGNPNVSDGQNGDETFLLFDDFQNGLSKWNIQQYASTTPTINNPYFYKNDFTAGNAVIQGDGTVKLNVVNASNGATGIISNDQVFTSGFSLETRRKQSVNSLNYFMNMGFGVLPFRSQNSEYVSSAHVSLLSSGYALYGRGEGVQANAGIYESADTTGASLMAGMTLPSDFENYHRWQFRYDSSGGIWVLNDDVYASSATDTTYLTTPKNVFIAQGEYYIGWGEDQIIDWVFVRKFSFPEPAMGTLQTEEQSKDPVGYWSFDEGYGTIAGDSAQNNDGVITGALWKNEDECVKGKCLYFDGAGDYVTVPNAVASSSLNFGTGDFTISTWLKTSVTTDGQRIFSKRDASLFGYEVYTSSSGKISVFLGTATTYITAEIEDKFIADGKWHHISLIFNRTTAIVTSYVDGVLQKSMSFSGAGNTSSNSISDLVIGGYGPTPASNNFSGYLDEPRIFPYARTAAEIKADYNSVTNKGATASVGAKEQDLNDGLVGHWKMDEASWNGTSGEVLDASGVGNNGQAVGAGGITGTTSTSKYGRAGEFDGTDDSVNFTDINLGTKHSFSLWARGNTTSKGLIGSAVTNYGLYYETGAFYYRVSTGSNTYWRYTISDSTTWHHYLVSRDGLKITLYVDGVSKGENSLQANVALTVDEIGSLGESVYWDGSIDDVRVYNRALSASEITRLYDTSPPPVLHMKFDEKTGQTVNNSASSTISGTLGDTSDVSTDDPTWKSSAECRFGGCLDFDGTADYIPIADNSALRGTQMTFSMWVRPDSRPAVYAGVIAHSNNSDGYNFLLTAPGVVSLYRRVSGAWVTVSSAVLPLGQWSYVTATINGTNVQMYTNGVAGNSSTDARETSFLNSQYQIGLYGASTYYFDGKIDDVRIYDYARTGKQILEDMQAGAPTQSVRAETGGTASGLMGYWKFDDVLPATTTEYSNTRFLTSDSSGRGNNAEVYNATSTPGKFGKGLGFDGTGDIGLVADAVVDTSVVYSCSMWVKTNTWGTHDSFGGDYVGADTGFLFYLDTATSLCLYTSATNKVCVDAPTTGVWHHYVATDDDTYMYFYVDGALIGKTASVTTDGGIFYIGTYLGSSSSAFDGQVDEVKMYNYALSAEEIAKDYNAGKVLNVAPAQNPAITGAASGMHPGGEAPIMHITLDERTGTTSTDKTGNGNDAGLGEGSAAPTWKGSGYCKKGACLEFDGVNDYAMSALSGTALTQLTVSLWVNRRAIQATQDGIFQWASALNDGAPFMLLASPAGSSVLWSYVDGGYRWSSYVLPNNEWHCVTITLDSSNLWTFYVDGVSKGTYQDDAAHYGQTVAARVYLGNGYNGYFNGRIDDVKIWNRTLTPAEIAYEYNGGKPAGHWKFDEGHGDYAYDASGNGNKGLVIIGEGGANSATTTAWADGATGKINGSLDFDGTDDYIKVPNSQSLDATTEYTFTAWVKPTNFYQFVNLFTRGAGDADDIEIYFASTVNLTLLHNRGTGSTCYTAGNPTPPLGVWTHMVVVWNNLAWKLYYNGIEQTVAAMRGAVANPTDTNSQVLIGKSEHSAFGATEHWKGLMDDVRFFNYALNAAQIKQVYNNSKALYFK
jgi:hypothetical protein